MINAVGNRLNREIARQSKLALAVEQSQIQVSTGTKLQRVSDDPRAAKRIAAIDREMANSLAWQNNVGTAAARVAQADGVLASAGSLVARAREVLLGAANGAVNAADRGTVAAELESIADEISGLENSRAGNGERLFAAQTARVMRFDADTAFAPLPSSDESFAIGGRSIVAVLADAAAAARAGDATAINAGLTELTTAIDLIADQRAKTGLAGARLDRISEVLTAREIAQAAERSGLADTDLNAAIARLNAESLTLEAAQAAFARINRQSLFDILR